MSKNSDPKYAFDLHSYCNLLNTKVSVLKMNKIHGILKNFEKHLEMQELNSDDLLSLKIIIYNIGKNKKLDKKYQKELVLKLVNHYLELGKSPS